MAEPVLINFGLSVRPSLTALCRVFCNPSIMKQYSRDQEDEAIGLRFVYRPAESKHAPVVIFVHGRAGNRDVMWAFERTVPPSCAIVAFEAFLPDPLGGYSWWDMASNKSKLQAIRVAGERLSSAWQNFQKMYGLSPNKVAAVGFSQGAILISASSFFGQIDLDCIGLLAGYPLIVEEECMPRTMPSVYMANGTEDETITIEQARNGREQLENLGVSVQFVEEKVGHKVGVQGIKSLRQWFEALLQ